MFEHAKFNKLEALSLGFNKINDIKVLNKVCFKKLRTLGFSKNKVTSNLEILSKIQYPNLKKVSLDYNGIEENENRSILSRLWNRYDYFYYGEKDLYQKTAKKFSSSLDN